MNIRINGKEKKLTENLNLKNVIEQFANNCTRVIAQVNGQIIKSPLWEKTHLKDGDTIELVTLVGGG